MESKKLTRGANPAWVSGAVTYKISYNRAFDKRKGNCYNQTIQMVLPREAFIAYNHSVFAFRTGVREQYRHGMVHGEDSYKYMFLKFLKEGDNYTTLTTAEAVASFFHIDEDKRYKNDRNTLIKVEIL